MAHTGRQATAEATPTRTVAARVARARHAPGPAGGICPCSPAGAPVRRPAGRGASTLLGTGSAEARPWWQTTRTLRRCSSDRPDADPSWVARLAAVRPEPDPAGRPPTAEDLDRILATADDGARPRRSPTLAVRRVRGAGPGPIRRGTGGRADRGRRARTSPTRWWPRCATRPTPHRARWCSSPRPTRRQQRGGLGAGGLGVVHRVRHGAGRHRTRLRGGVEERRGAGTAPVRALFELGRDESLLGWVNVGTPAPLGRKKARRRRRRPGGRRGCSGSTADRRGRARPATSRSGPWAGRSRPRRHTPRTGPSAGHRDGPRRPPGASRSGGPPRGRPTPTTGAGSARRTCPQVRK